MFTDWIYGLLGGLLIGLGGLTLLVFNGRIMGASGILGKLIETGQADEKFESLIFLAGVFGTPLIILNFVDLHETNITTSPFQLITAGLLVGAGTRIANGCTSGHGVCGISRLSIRGLTATATYIMAGAFTMAALRSFWGII
jgi:uncharacterized membrane protein YedE/YeeE